MLVDTHDTATAPEERIERAVRAIFDLTPAGIIRALDLRRPIYAPTSAYGHFGRSGPGFTWERVDRAKDLAAEVGTSS